MDTKHPLSEFLSDTGIRKSAFARSIGVTPARVSQIIKGDVPSLKVAMKIEAETKGRVRPQDLARVGDAA